MNVAMFMSDNKGITTRIQQKNEVIFVLLRDFFCQSMT